MPKQLTFLRHYKLEYPFDDASNMSFDNYVALAEGRVDPHTNADLNQYLNDNFKKIDFSEYDVILTSNTNRGIETAQHIKQFYSLNIEIIPNELFNEIPSIVEGSDKSNVRKHRVLDKEGNIKRIKDIDKYLNKREEIDILIISHSYLIGQLNYFYNILNRDIKKYDEVQADSFEIGGYLKGFTVLNK